VAISVKVIEADFTRTLPRGGGARSQAGDCFVCDPPNARLVPAPPLAADPDLGQAQVAILDSDPRVAEAMARALQAEGFTTRVFASARELMAQPEPSVGGCLVVNTTMPDMSGLELQRELTVRQWPLAVIFLTSADDIKTVVRGMKAGAINCLRQPVQPAELLEAVREAFAESRVVRAQRAARLHVQQLLECLTPREREVLDLAVAGLLVKQIAARLGTAEKTVKTHKGRLMRKMQVRSTLALVQLMVAAGLPPVPWAGQSGDNTPAGAQLIGALRAFR